jgi:hypothetical protein
VERRFDLTDWYVGRFGEPAPGQQVFIRVRQQRNGWESAQKDVSDVVPAQQPTVNPNPPSPFEGSQGDRGVLVRRRYRETPLCMAPVACFSPVWGIRRALGLCVGAGKWRHPHWRDRWRGG